VIEFKKRKYRWKHEIKRVCSNVTGKHTLHEETKRSSEMFCEFAIANNRINMITQFQYTQIHKVIGISPDHTVINQIDHL